MIEHKLAELGRSLPTPATPAYKYVPVVVNERVAWVSGQIPWADGALFATGKVGAAVSLDVAKEAAVHCVLQGLAVLKAEIGSLDRIARILKVTGFVASAPGFNQQPAVIDAASGLLLDLLGEAGRHARSAVGVAELPRDVPVEIEMVVAIREAP